MRPLVVIPTVFVAFCIGYAASYFWHGNKTPPSPSPTPPDSVTVSPSEPDESATVNSLDVIDHLERAGEQASLSSLVATLALVDEMSPEEQRDMLDYFEENLPKSHSIIMAAMLLSWTERDPAGALAYAVTRENNYTHIRTVINAWVENDFDSAYVAANQINNSGARSTARETIIRWLAKSDPNRALQLIDSTDQNPDYLMQTVYSQWAKNDPDAAWQSIESITSLDDRQKALHGYFTLLGMENPKETFGVAMNRLKGVERDRILSQLAQNWLRKDVDEALDYFSKIEDSRSRKAIAQNLSWSLAREAPEKGFYWALENVKGQQLTSFVSSTIGAVAEKNPEKAAMMIEQLPYGESYSSAIRSVARDWAKKDPQGAIEWVYSLPEGSERRDAFMNFSASYARNDVEGAFEYAKQNPNRSEQHDLLGDVARTLVDQDPLQALERINAESDYIRRAMLDNAMLAWTQRDAPAVIAYLEANPEMVKKSGAIYAFIRTLARETPAEAARWSLTLEGQTQERAITEISQAWLKQDSLSASAWIAELPAGKSRQAALTKLVNAVYRNEPDAAFDWALEIESASSRKNATKNSVIEWQKRDPISAKQHISESNLPQEEKDELLKLIKN